MFVGRKAELKQLNSLYEAKQNTLVMLYGRDGIGKTKLIKEFISDKKAWLYEVRECTEKKQLSLMKRELRQLCGQSFLTEGAEEATGYFQMFKAYAEVMHKEGRKPIIIIDEFQGLLCPDNTFNYAFTEFMRSEPDLMLVFISSSVNWVENDMVGKIGMAARYITHFIKLKEFSFMELVEFFPELSVEECIYVTAVLGGVPRYLELWNCKKNIGENINELFIKPGAVLKYEAERILKKELRELSAYNTILAAMAEGNMKLNDIYKETGFSRAKISVYIKNLIQMDIAEKAFSYEAINIEASQKGLYRIKDKLIAFWYGFVFKDMSLIENSGAEAFLKENDEEFSEYASEAFNQVCTEYLRLMNVYKKLGSEYGQLETWYGKSGRIEIVAKDGNNKILVGKCFWKDDVVRQQDMDKLFEISKEAAIKPYETVIFAKSGFDDEIKKKYSDNKAVRLVELKDL